MHRSTAWILSLGVGIACTSPDSPAVTAPPDGPLAGRSATVPGAPTNARATAGDAQATVTWQAPRKDGGSAILSYRVVSTPGSLSATVNAPTLTATVTGLTNGTSYTFKVYARNSVGESVASSASNAVVPAGSPPPPPPPPTGRWLSGYYVGYQRSLYPESEVDFSLLTHIFVGNLTHMRHVQRSIIREIELHLTLSITLGPT